MNDSDLGKMAHDVEWNQKRQGLQAVVLKAARELMEFSGAAKISLDVSGVKVVIEVTERNSDGCRRLQ